MAKNFLHVLSVYFVLFAARADDSTFSTKEGERRWNTPPELIPEQVMRSFDVKTGRSLSIPITTNINVGVGDHAHSLGFEVGPEAVNYSENNSYNRPSSGTTGAVAQSQSVSIVTGPSIGAASQTQALSFGSAADTSIGISVGSMHSLTLSSTAGNKFPRGMNVRFPGHGQRPPVWTNIQPNHNNNGHQPSRIPKLDIDVKPHHEQNRGPITLHVSSQQPRRDNKQPQVHIHKWHPSYRWYFGDVQT